MKSKRMSNGKCRISSCPVNGRVEDTHKVLFLLLNSEYMGVYFIHVLYVLYIKDISKLKIRGQDKTKGLEKVIGWETIIKLNSNGRNHKGMDKFEYIQKRKKVQVT